MSKCEIIVDYKTKICFKCKQKNPKYSLTSKTKDFSLNETNDFKNEIIHFYNIDSKNTSIYIYLEIDGKKIKPENSKNFFHKLLTKDIKEEKEEMNFIILDNISVKLLIRIINRFEIKKTNSFYLKPEEFVMRSRGYTEPRNVHPPSMSIKDKIKIFSGEYIRKENKINLIPGKLKIPNLFQKDNLNSDRKKDKSKINVNGAINGHNYDKDN